MRQAMISLNPDPLADFEKLLHTTGAWCDTPGKNKIQHYYIARNKSIRTAISLCRESIQTFDKLTQMQPFRRCLVCDLLAGNRLEAEKEKINNIEMPNDDEVSQPNQIKMEII